MNLNYKLFVICLLGFNLFAMENNRSLEDARPFKKVKYNQDEVFCTKLSINDLPQEMIHYIFKALANSGIKKDENIIDKVDKVLNNLKSIFLVNKRFYYLYTSSMAKFFENFIKAKAPEKYKYLMFALKRNALTSIKYLLTKENLNIDYLLDNGFNLLLASAFYDKDKFINYLIEKGADVNVEGPKGMTPIIIAASKGFFNCVKVLLESEDTEVDSKDNNGTTSLMHACKNGYIDIVKYLILAGAGVDLVDNDGCNTLMYASYNNQLNIVEYLLQNGGLSIINSKNNNEETTLMLAAQRGFLEVVKLLIENNAYKNIRNLNGETALMLAAREGHLEIVKLLVKNNANKDLINNLGQTAADIARLSGNNQIEQYLLNGE